MRRALLALGLVAALAAGCGGDDDDDEEETGGSSGDAMPQLTVSAAASMTEALTACAQDYPDAEVKLQFAGSDELAAQIRQGVKPDVFASANTKLPDQLFAAGLVKRPTVFAGNRLVLAVPGRSSKVTSLAGVEQRGVKLAIGSPSVPIGSYTHMVLDRLPTDARKKILANVRSEEPDVKGIVGKLTQGAVAAGIVYITDVKATKGQLKAIELPPKLKPSAAYGAAVVKGAKHSDEARKFTAGLLNGQGQSALRAAGFEAPPK